MPKPNMYQSLHTTLMSSIGQPFEIQIRTQEMHKTAEYGIAVSYTHLYLSVTPWGDLYPCHQFVGQEEFLMGNVDDGIVKPEIADDFRSCSVYSKEKCKNCFAKFYCSGGCMANSYNFHGTIHDCYDVGCEMQRKRVECAIMIKAALADA